ncbi:MAG TPA: YtxH domain-containing protein [Gemmatimonadales bacterium]|nr:YtxH domain-containing protein [Gemmatimonadales bacterium]
MNRAQWSLIVGILLLFPKPSLAQRLSQESLTFQAMVYDLGRDPLPLDWQVAQGETHGHALTGLLIGTAVGIAAAYILFAPGSNACSGSGDYEKNCRYYRAGIVVGSAGLGALIGSLIRTEKS